MIPRNEVPIGAVFQYRQGRTLLVNKGLREKDYKLTSYGFYNYRRYNTTANCTTLVEIIIP